MKIGITGAGGFLGYHLRSFFFKKEGFDVIPIFKSDFSDPSSLAHCLQDCDVIIHLAGVNRGEEKAVHDANVQITEQLISALEITKSRPHIIFSSSTHIFSNTLYGAAKRKCAQLISEWSQKSTSKFTEVVIPHVFGEFGKPFYNSAISTFCYQLAIGQNPTIIHDTELELLHGYQAGEQILQIIDRNITGQVRFSGHKILVSEALSKLLQFDLEYRSGIIPRFNNFFDLLLFNTYRSYLYPENYPVDLKIRSDNRGSLFETVKTLNGGQCFLSITHPGVTRGNHFHYYKLERFLVVSGEATISIRKLHSSEIRNFKVSGSAPCFIDIPTYHTHNITNNGKSDLLTLFWSHEIFNPQLPDTYAETV